MTISIFSSNSLFAHAPILAPRRSPSPFFCSSSLSISGTLFLPLNCLVLLESDAVSDCFSLFRHLSLSISLSSVDNNMESAPEPTLYPLHRCKTLHLVRHAQGVHNVAGEKDHSAYLSEDLFDAHLTELGWSQVDNLHKHVCECGLSKRIDLVIVSPLLRTLQTAVGVFGGEGSVDGTDTPPLMVSNAWDSERLAISSLNCPPFIAVELCREQFGLHPCDRRQSIKQYQTLFPAIDFSLVEADEDVMWKSDGREKNEEVAARGLRFMNWLWTRKEKEIAIVTHSGFLFHTLSNFGSDCHASVKSEIQTHFANCELRSVVLVDRSMMGSDLATTNFPGKVPSGLDIPSDAAAPGLSVEESTN